MKKLILALAVGLIMGVSPVQAENDPLPVKPGTYICGNTGYIAVIRFHALTLLDEGGEVHFKAPVYGEDYSVYTDFWGDADSPQVMAYQPDKKTIHLSGHGELKNLDLTCSHA